MTEQRLIKLIVRRLAGELDAEGAHELDEWAKGYPDRQGLLAGIGDEADLERKIQRWKQIDPASGYARWADLQRVRRNTRIIHFAGYAAAASLLVIVGLHSLFRLRGKSNVPIVGSHSTEQSILPGRNMAILTLDNGRQIVLDSTGPGQLGIQGGARLIKTDNDGLKYVAETGDDAGTVAYNVLTTPRSGQYRLTLPDGSRVWLNNISSIRYPTAFTGKERRVEVSGEAYFEVQKDEVRPFLVKARDEEVEVLGTSFNIMAYPEEEETQTTLLSGAVRIISGGRNVQLRPDEQAQIGAGGIKVRKSVPSEDIVSWKNGFFYFGRASSFANVMRQLARWYDVEVVYEGKPPGMEFDGKIDRNLPLNELLKYLDKNQIHFRLDGRRLIVLPS